MRMIDFQWRRCRDGYRLEKKRADFALVSASTRFERYRPMEIGGLFAIFAGAEPSPEGMRSFCSRFGLLGGGMPHLAPQKGDRTAEGALVGDFLWHHQAMRAAMDALEAGRVAELAQFWNAAHGFPVIRIELQVRDDGGMEMVFAPPALIQAIWFQFAQHACEGSQLLRCERCSTPFLVGSRTGRRSSSKWCSNACKVAAYQERQARKEIAQ